MYYIIYGKYEEYYRIGVMGGSIDVSFLLCNMKPETILHFKLLAYHPILVHISQVNQEEHDTKIKTAL